MRTADNLEERIMSVEKEIVELKKENTALRKKIEKLDTFFEIEEKAQQERDRLIKDITRWQQQWDENMMQIRK